MMTSRTPKAKTETRRYIVNWEDYAGIRLSYHASGGVASATFQGCTFSAGWFNRECGAIKVWLDDNNGIHVDGCKNQLVELAIIDGLRECLGASAPRRVTLQGHGRTGWDTETVETMEDIHAYLRTPHRGNIHVYIDCQERILPAGLGKRVQSFGDDEEEEEIA